MPGRSAGLLLYREREGELQVLLVHPGGPLWARRHTRAWSLPKGEIEGSESPSEVAEREFAEELGSPAPPGGRLDLGEARQASGKVVQAWAVEGDFDTDSVSSNTFETEWPPRSGRRQTFPEVDRAEWFGLPQAHQLVFRGQEVLLDRLAQALGRPEPD